MSTTELATIDAKYTMVMSADEAHAELERLQDFVRSVMVLGHDYGKIPGAGDKPTLLLPGAQKLCEIYGLAPIIRDIEAVEEWEKIPPFFNYRVRLALVSKRTDVTVAEGVGACNSKEVKYKYRTEWWKGGGTPPDGQGYIKQANGGFSRKVENTETADLANTILKMAKKRALVDATLAATRSSGLFTQDIEDMSPESLGHEPATAKPAPKNKAKGKPSGGDAPTCADCGQLIEGYTSKANKTYTPADMVKFGIKDHGRALCRKCAWAAKEAKEKGEQDGKASNEAGEDNWVDPNAQEPEA